MPDKAQESSQAAHRLAAAVDQVLSVAVPGLADLQVAAAPDGVVVVSARVSSVQERQRAEEVARSVPGVRRLIGSFTVA